ncbi:MAG: GtrA family protein [Gaiellales bacterium]
MDDARTEVAEVGLKGHARRFHVGVRRPHNWLELIRYCSVGATGFVINQGAFVLANRPLPYPVAFVIAFTLAATSNFVWNRIWTFRVKHGVPHHQYARFLTVSALALCFDLSVLTLLVESAGIAESYAAATAIILATPISFLGNKLWSFR